MYRIQTLNAISPVYEELLPKDEYTVGADIADADAVMVRSADMHETQLDPHTLCVARAGAGVNNIPLDRFAEEGVVVFNSPGANANAVKELVIAGLLLASRDIAESLTWVQTLKGQGAEVGKLVEKGKKAFIGPELAGKTLGVIGLGEIGVRVANAASALDMHVLGYDPYISVEHAWTLSREVQSVRSMEEIFRRCDYITIHVPLMDATRGTLDAQAFAKMKDGVAVLNFARGELTDIPALLDALQSGKVRRYVTDFPTDELLGLKNVVCIPHLGASTPESEDNCVRMVAAEIKEYLTSGTIRNSVNYPRCEPGARTSPRLVILHQNVPNVVSAITSGIAARNINIATMLNKSKGKYAVTILDLDDTPDEALLAHLRSLETLYRVRLIH